MCCLVNGVRMKQQIKDEVDGFLNQVAGMSVNDLTVVRGGIPQSGVDAACVGASWEVTMEVRVKDLDARRQAVFYVALAQQVQPVLSKSVDYEYAARTIDLCWSWIERRDVQGVTLFHLYHDDDDYGVEPAMFAEHDPVLWNAWACIGWALLYTDYCVYQVEGGAVPETIECIVPDEVPDEFIRHYRTVVGETQVPDLLADFLEQLPDGQLIEAIVRTKVDELSTAESFRYASEEQLTPILNVLTGIVWPCPESRIPVVIDVLGWEFIADRVHVEADTHLPLNRTTGEFAHPHGSLTRLSFPVSDAVNTADPRSAAVLEQSFLAVIGEMECVLGPASGQDGNEDVWWDLESGGRVHLERLSRFLDVQVLSQQLADAERYEATHDMSVYDDQP